MSNKPLIQLFQDEIDAIVKKYSLSGIELGAAVGALEMSKLALLANQDDEEEEDLF